MEKKRFSKKNFIAAVCSLLLFTEIIPVYPIDIDEQEGAIVDEPNFSVNEDVFAELEQTDQEQADQEFAEENEELNDQEEKLELAREERADVDSLYPYETYADKQILLGQNLYSRLSPGESFPRRFIAKRAKILNTQVGGWCWAYGTMQAVESNIITNNILANAEEENFDLSEKHLVYFTALPDLGFYEQNSRGLWGCGSTQEMASNTLLNWVGPVYYEDAPVEQGPAQEDYSISYPTLNSRFNSLAHLQNIRITGSLNTNDIKYLISKYGAVIVTRQGVHATTYIGWNDDADNGNGCFILRDNHEEDAFHSADEYDFENDVKMKGYQLYSPYSEPYISGQVMALDFEEKNNFDHNYYHSENMTLEDVELEPDHPSNCLNYEEESLAAFNVGEEGDCNNLRPDGGMETIEAIGAYIRYEDIDVEYEVRKQSFSGQLLAEGTLHVDYAGYYTIPLNNKILANHGDKICVIFKSNKRHAIGGGIEFAGYESLDYSIKPHDTNSGKCKEYGVFTQSNYLGFNRMDTDDAGKPAWHDSNCDLIIHMYTSDCPWTLNTEGFLTQDGACIIPAGGEVAIPYTGTFNGGETTSDDGYFTTYAEGGYIHVEANTTENVSGMIKIADADGNVLTIPGTISTGITSDITCNIPIGETITIPYTEQSLAVSRDEAYLYRDGNRPTQAINSDLITMEADTTNHVNDLTKALPEIVLTDNTAGETIDASAYTVACTYNNTVKKVTINFKADSAYAGHDPIEFPLAMATRDISGLDSWGKEYIRLSDNKQVVNKDQSPVGRLYTGAAFTLKNGSFLLHDDAGTFIRVNDTNFSIDLSDNTNAGTAKIHIEAKEGSNYTGSADLTFTIDPIQIIGVTPIYDASSIEPAGEGEKLEALPSAIKIEYKEDPKNLTTVRKELTKDVDYTAEHVQEDSNSYVSNYKITFSDNYRYGSDNIFTGQIVAAKGSLYNAIASAEGTLWEDKVKNAVRIGDTPDNSSTLAVHLTEVGAAELQTDAEGLDDLLGDIWVTGLAKGEDYEVACAYTGLGANTIVIRDLEAPHYEERISCKIYLPMSDVKMEDTAQRFNYKDASGKTQTVTYNLYPGETAVNPEVGSVYIQSQYYNDGNRVDLVKDRDYRVEYKSAAAANNPYGMAAVVYVDLPIAYSMYYNSLKKNYNVRPVTINDATAVFEGGEGTGKNIFNYDGNAITPIPTLTYTDCANPKTLIQGTDFEIVGYENNTAPGVATVTIKDKHTEATRTLPYYIRRKVTAENVVLEAYSFRYKGTAIKPAVTVVVDGERISPDLYTVTYANNTAPADANDETHPYVTVMMAQGSSYYGTVNVPFTIRGDYITADMITLDAYSFAYKGIAITPKVTVMDEGKKLKEKTDYTVTCSNNINPALSDADPAPTVTVTGKGKYSRQAEVTFSITKSIASFDFDPITPQPIVLDEDGNVIPTEPEVNVKEDKTGLTPVEGVDYEVYYLNNTVVSNRKRKSTVLIVGNGLYAGSKAISFDTAPAGISADENGIWQVKNIPDEVYDGTLKKPAPEIVYVCRKDGAETEIPMQEKVDYTLKYANNKNAGTATITITGKGNFKGTIYKTFKINEMSIEDLTITVPDMPYNKGKALKPTVAISYTNPAGKPVKLGGKDFSVTYRNNNNSCEIMTTDAAKDTWPTATITCKGNFKGTKDVNFSIMPTLAAKMSVTIKGNAKKQFAYTGEPIEFNDQLEVTIKEGKEPKVLTECTNYDAVKAGEETEYNGDYLVFYGNNVNAGKNAYVRVKGIRNYAGTKDLGFSIIAKPAASGIAVADIPDQIYTGAARKPFEDGKAVVTDADSGEALTLGKDYTVVYKGNINPGTATATISGKGNYTGRIQKTFKINWIIWDSEHITVEPVTPVLYTGAKQMPAVKVWYKAEGEDLLLNSKTMYSLAFDTAVKTGEYKVKATPNAGAVKKGYISGTNPVEATFEIKARDINGLNTPVIPIQTLKKAKNGAIIPAAPAVALMNGKTKLVLNKDYVVAYENNTKAGKATMTITGIGGYEGEKTLTFYVK